METPDNILRIGYAGSLKGHRPGSEVIPAWRRITDWIWTYRNRNLQPHTRSGYFLFQGLAQLKKDRPELANRIQVALWGLIDPLHQEQVQSFGLQDQVQIDGYFSKAESAAKLQACDVLFLPLESSDDPLFIPGKLFDYLRLGKPVLVLGPESDCSRILDQAGLGIQVSPTDTKRLSQALQDLIEHKVQLPERYKADQTYIEETFHFRHIAQRMANVFEEVLQE